MFIAVTLATLVASAVLGLLGAHVGHACWAVPDLGSLLLDDAGRAVELVMEEAGRTLSEAPIGIPLDPGTAEGTAGLLGVMVFAVVPWALYMIGVAMMLKTTRAGEEQGSSRWATSAEIRPFATSNNKDPYNTLLFSKSYGLALSRTSFDLNHDRNANVIVVGGSGTGKTRYYVKPNVCQMNSDYIITDPKGELLPEVGQMLVDAGYEVRCFNTFTPASSLRYNPFHYIKTDLQIVEWVGAFFALTSDDQKKGGDQFWDDSAQLLLGALIAFLRDYGKLSDYNVGGLLKLLAKAKASEDESFSSPLDHLFEEIETGYVKRVVDDGAGELRASEASVTARRLSGTRRRREVLEPSTLYNRTLRRAPYECVRRGADGQPLTDAAGNVMRGLRPDEDFALACYKKFKSGAGKTLQSIIITVSVKFNAIATSDVLGVLAGEDEMRLDKLGDADQHTAIFCVFKDVNQSTLGFLHGMLVWQAMNVMCDRAINEYGGRLPTPVNLILDEFKSLHMPKSIADMISVIRSRRIMMSIILQSLSQLEELYDRPTAAAIKDCCDSLLFLGSNSLETCKEISESIGKQTIRAASFSVSHGGSGGYSKSEQAQGRDLIDHAEIARMPGDRCILRIRGANPAQDQKYPLEHHPRYALIDPGHDPVRDALGRPVKAKYRERFDVQAYMARKRAEAEEERRRAVAEARAERRRRWRRQAAQATEGSGGRMG